eukprot:gene2558-6142_t
MLGSVPLPSPVGVWAGAPRRAVARESQQEEQQMPRDMSEMGLEAVCAEIDDRAPPGDITAGWNTDGGPSSDWFISTSTTLAEALREARERLRLLREKDAAEEEECFSIHSAVPSAAPPAQPDRAIAQQLGAMSAQLQAANQQLAEAQNRNAQLTKELARHRERERRQDASTSAAASDPGGKRFRNADEPRDSAASDPGAGDHRDPNLADASPPPPPTPRSAGIAAVFAAVIGFSGCATAAAAADPTDHASLEYSCGIPAAAFPSVSFCDTTQHTAWYSVACAAGTVLLLFVAVLAAAWWGREEESKAAAPALRYARRRSRSAAACQPHRPRRRPRRGGQADRGPATPAGGARAGTMHGCGESPRRARCIALMMFAALAVEHGGLLGVRLGEAKVPGKLYEGSEGGWGIATSNVTALNAPGRESAVTALPAEVIGLQETRLTADGQKVMTRSLRAKGWQVIWGAPQQQGRSDSVWDAGGGGAAVLVKNGIPVAAPKIDTPLRKRLWASQRWAHAAVGYASGGRSMHIFSVYGHTTAEKNAEARAKNEALLQDVLEAAAELGSVPVFLVGDINIHPNSSEVLAAAMRDGGWQDLAATTAAMHGESPLPTCFPQRSSEGTRIDVILGNAVAGAAVQQVRLLEDTGIPTHRPLVAQVSLARYVQMVPAIHQPIAFPVENWRDWSGGGGLTERRLREEELAAKVLQAHPPRPDTASVAEQWQAFCETAEEYLIERSGDTLQHNTSRYRGRGRCREPTKRESAAPRGGTEAGSHDCTQRSLAKLQRQIEELDRQLLRHSRQQEVPAALPYKAQHLWEVARKRG